MKQNALFIINPISGGKKKDNVPELIKKHFNPRAFDHVVIYSDGVAHARQLAQDGLSKFELIVAVGGDGTVNEVASALVNTPNTLGIIPFGSGNGLSRFLQVPMDTADAIKTLGLGNVQLIDSAVLNGHPFFNIAGIGFDAHISEVFSHGKQRGFISYIKSSFREVLNYQPQVYRIDIDGRVYNRDAFMLSLANSSQYGNNAHISPDASVQDGLLDVCIIKPFPLWRFIEMGLRMVTKTTGQTKYVEIIRGKHIKITSDHPGPVHLDGEPFRTGAVVDIKIVPASLKVITGTGFR